MLLYLSCVQIFLTSLIYLLPASKASVFIASIILTFLFGVSGYFIHFNDVPAYLKYLNYASPTEWLLPFLLNRELTPTALSTVLASPPLCRNKQVSIIWNHLAKINNFEPKLHYLSHFTFKWGQCSFRDIWRNIQEIKNNSTEKNWQYNTYILNVLQTYLLWNKHYFKLSQILQKI